MASIRVNKPFHHIRLGANGIQPGIYDSEDGTIALVLSDMIESGYVEVLPPPAPDSERALVEETIAAETPAPKRKGK